MSIYHLILSCYSACQQYNNMDEKVERTGVHPCNTADFLAFCTTGHLTSINLAININTCNVIF